MLHQRRTAVAVALGVLISLASCGEQKAAKPSAEKKAAYINEYRDKLKPKDQALFDIWLTVEPGMGEKEVDALFKGYNSVRVEFPGGIDSDPEGNPLPRPSTFGKWYDHEPSEYGYCAAVSFDDQHVVLFKEWSQYIK